MSLTAGSLSKVSVSALSDVLQSGAATGGTTPYSYQWYRSTTSGFTPGTATAVSGATSLTLADSGLTAATVYYYAVISTDSNGTPLKATSSQLTVTTRSGLKRFTGNVFGSSSGFQQMEEFGSFANGTAVFSTDPAAITSLSNWLVGWFSAVIGGNSPAIEDMNAVFYALSYMICYLLSQGVQEWDSGTSYNLGTIVTDGLGNLFTSLTNSNSGNNLASTSNWRKITGIPQVEVVSTSYTALPGDDFIEVSGSVTQTLPDAVANKGKRIEYVKTDSNASTVTFNTQGGQTMSGTASGSLTLTEQYSFYAFRSDGTNWYIVSAG